MLVMLRSGSFFVTLDLFGTAGESNGWHRSRFAWRIADVDTWPFSHAETFMVEANRPRPALL